MKKPSKLFKSIRFAKMDPNHDKGPKGSTDDEEHYTVSSQEFQQQVDHVKQRAMQEENSVEQIDELSKPTLGSYVKKASFSAVTSGMRAGKANAQGEDKKNLPEPGTHDIQNIMKRERGISKAVNRLSKEETEIQEAKKDQYDEGEYDREGDMAKSDLRSIIANAKRLHDMIDDADNLPEWVQSKITKSEDYISTVANYITSEITEQHIQEASKKIKINFKMPPESLQDKMYRQHQEIRKKRGAPDPEEYKKMGAQKQKEIDAMKEDIEQLEEGRPSQRHPLEGHEYHKKSDEALIHIAKDAHQAAEAMKGHNTTAENKYRDQANDSATVRHFRKTSGTPDWYKKKYGHMKEDVEQIDEISKELKTSYRQKAIGDIRALRPHAEKGEYTDLAKNVMKKRMAGVNRSVKESNFDQYTEKVEAPTGELKDTCWKGYTAIGLKNKNGKKVPNCVPESVQIQESRKAQIVREAIKKAKEKVKNKDDDKFEPEPELISQVHKIDNV